MEPPSVVMVPRALMKGWMLSRSYTVWVLLVSIVCSLLIGYLRAVKKPNTHLIPGLLVHQALERLPRLESSEILEEERKT